jgi:uncharacterized iron-regulated protein
MRPFLLAALWAALLVVPMGCKRYSDMTEAPKPAAQTPASGVTPGQFLDGDGLPVDEARLGAQAAQAAYVLIGEGHPIACDHLAQARVLVLMAEAGAPPVVGLEMVSLDMQPVLDLFNKGLIGVDDLEEGLKWSASWGYPFEVYRPLFETARKYDLPLFALNAPRDVARKAGKDGLKGLTMEERLGLPAKIIASPPEQEGYLRQVFDSHPGGQPKDVKAAWKSFLTVQALWDTTMARRAVEARVALRRPVAVIAGAGHVERGWGVASRLAVFDPQGQRLLIMPWRGGEGPDKAEADLFFYCPEVKRPRLGVTLEVTDQAIVIKAVEAGSRAEAAGFKPGDVLVSAGGTPLKKLSDLHEATVRALDAGSISFSVRRGGESLEIPVNLPRPEKKTP